MPYTDFLNPVNSFTGLKEKRAYCFVSKAVILVYCNSYFSLFEVGVLFRILYCLFECLLS